MEELPGWASSIHKYRGHQWAAYQPDAGGEEGGGWPGFSHSPATTGAWEEVLAFTWMPPLHPPFTPAGFHFWGFLALSAISHPMEEDESSWGGFQHSGHPLAGWPLHGAQGFRAGSRRLKKGHEAKPWLCGVRPLCNSTEDDGAAKFQATWSSLQISQVLAKFNKPVHKLKVK